MEELRISIYSGDTLIARFMSDIDADNFLDDCNERYPDVEFTKKYA